MAIWKVTTRDKKSVEEQEQWTKDGVTIVRSNGYRWGSWIVTTDDDEEPEFELEACPFGSDDEDSVDMYNCGYDSELESLDDGWYMDWHFPDDFDEDEAERIREGWDEDSYEFMENEGWSNNETECWAWGGFDIENVNDDGSEDDDWDPVEALEDVVSDLGASLGMPMTEEEQEEAYTIDCPHCDWRGPMVDAEFKDGNFHCPKCLKSFGDDVDRVAERGEE